MQEFIEKLIGRLEEEREISYADFDEYLMKYELDNDFDEDDDWFYKGLIRAIEIVNQLAEEYDNDFCEWEKGSSGYVGYPAYYSRCCTTNSNGLEMQTHIISDWKFCPYCGKKIKVVPYQPKGE